MANEPATLLLRHIRRLASPNQASAPSDRDLLVRFAAGGDEDAFGELVRRHGPLVLRACRRTLTEASDVEDAFQATFLVLARKAGSVRWGESVAGFLFAVAHNICRRIRDSDRRRIRHERQVPARFTPDPLSELTVRELVDALDEELTRLPEKYRSALILCHLEGATRDEAARQLGCTVAALKGRLERGKERLREALTRRGVALPAAAAGLLGVEATAQAAVPAELAGGTASLVGRLLASAPAAEGTRVAALAREALAGPAARLKPLAALLLAAAALAAGTGLLATALPGTPAEKEPAPAAAPADRADAFGDALPAGALARLGTLRFNHGYSLNALHFSPDGKTIVSQGNGIIRRWDAADGRERAHISTGRNSFDEPTALLLDGKTLVCMAQDNDGDFARFWDLAGGKCARTVPLPVRRNEWSVSRRNSVSSDGRLGAAHTPEAVHVFDLQTDKQLYKLPRGGKDIEAVVFAGRDWLVSVDTKHTIEVWEARTGKPIRSFSHGGPAAVLRASADGRLLAVIEHHTHAIDKLLDRDVVHVWDLASGKRLHTLPAQPKSWLLNVQFSADGKQMVGGCYGQDHTEVLVWDVETGRQIHTLKGAYGQILAISPDGTRLAEGSLTGKFEVWDLRSGRKLSPDEGRHAHLSAIALSASGDRAYSVGYTSISTWDATTGRRLHSIELPLLNFTDPHRRFSPDGRFALTFSGQHDDVRLHLWDVRAGRQLHTLHSPGTGVQVGATFSPDGKLLATCQFGEQSLVRLYDVAEGKELSSFKDTKSGYCWRQAFMPDGRTLVLLGRQVVGYRVPDGKEVFCWKPERAPTDSRIGIAIGGKPVDPDTQPAWRGSALSPTGTRIAGILGGGFGREHVADRIVLYDARTGRLLRRCNDSGESGRDYERLEFSPDGRLLATSDGGAIHLWEEVTGKKVATFDGHRGEVHGLAFSGDGRRLASAGEDYTILVWDLTGGQSRADLHACWRDLAGEDAAAAWRAVWALAAAPGLSVPFVKERLRPAVPVSAAKLNRLIADLDSDEFKVRDEATRELEKLGDLAASALRQALAGRTSPEARRRLEDLNRLLEGAIVTGEALRALRATAALEHAATAEARQLLEALAAGAEGARLTQEARAALGRLARRPPP
jgi:RNA polymerase sigma factor (sigma-70 family)